MLKKFLVSMALVVLFSLPQVATAQTSNIIPEFNPICWKKDQCDKTRAGLMGVTVEDLKKTQESGWISEPPCDQSGWGKCLPAGVAKTEIRFGGRTQFANLGVYIALLYNYAITVAGILAVVMIIVAGFQWITSGGNSEGITSAKKRIGGAMMGAFLAYMSYFILSAVNPALTTFRLPQIWMIRPQNLVPDLCSSLPSSTIFGFAMESKDQASVVKPKPDLAFDLSYSGLPKQPADNPNLNKAWADTTFYCGSRWFVKDGGEATCFGGACPNGQTCTKIDIATGKETTKYDCASTKLFGKIINSSIATKFGLTGCFGLADGWEKPEIVDTGVLGQGSVEHEIWLLCNGKTEMYQFNSGDSKAIDFPDYQFYSSNFSNDDLYSFMSGKCGSASNVKGWLIKQEMNVDCCSSDQDHYFGYGGPGKALDLGDQGFITKNNSSGLYTHDLTHNAQNISPQYLISTKQLLDGVELNFDANDVHNIHNCQPVGSGDMSEDPERVIYKGYLK